ncbi:MAG TPA: hypothetical protein VLP43_01560 [Solirubrobacteraceae bacterium]|nr:hypothetical protein [Solirubrobacteraceae bacterium]
MRAVAMLIAAQARRWPARWLLPAFGIALAAGFAGTVRIEATVAATQSARTVLDRLGPLDRVVRVNWPGDVTPAVQTQALAALHGARLGSASQALVLNPVRLNGELVRPAAITPLARWAAPAPHDLCHPRVCPMRLVDRVLRRTTLTTFGVRIEVRGRTGLASPAPLGYVPAPTDSQPPVLLTGDLAGLDGLPGLSGIYRSRSWFSLLSTRGVNSWELPGLVRQLEQAQASLLVASPQFSFSAPFDALAAARAQANTAPRRLLLVGGGALAAVLMFVVLTGGSLRPALEEDLARLRLMGARPAHGLLFAAVQAAVICLPAVVAGAGLALGAGALLAEGAGVPVGPALTHSLLTPLGTLLAVGGWAAGTALLALCLLVPARTQIADGLALLALSVLIVALGSGAEDSALALVLAPLSALAAGVLIVRIMRMLLPVAERGLRHGPVLARLAVVGLARGPAAPAIAIAFLAVSTGLGGFALALRTTLARNSADQASQQVPLDVLVGPTANFTRPLALAPLGRWQTIARGAVFPVRRTDATFQRGGASIAVPALGLSAGALPLIRGWRAGDLSAPPRMLAARLAPTGPARTSAPVLPQRTRTLSLTIRSPQLDLSVTADLRDRAGDVVAVGLGTAGPHTAVVTGRVPPGGWELEAFELSEPTGLQVTNDHQNGEGAAAATQRKVPVALGPALAADGRGRRLLAVSLRGWRGVGAMSNPPAPRSAARFAFSESGLTGVVRPSQPGDPRPLPVLADSGTAAGALRGGRLALSIDGLPVNARVVGVLRRFPTVSSGSAGFVVADEAQLAAALDAQQPGQGRPDELWIATRDAVGLRAALHRGALARLGVRFRVDIQRALSRAPTARAVLGTLIGAAALGAVLALIGLLVVIAGALRDRRIEQDLAGQGLGPRALASELRARVLLAGLLGVSCGLLVALALVRLAVRAVPSIGTVTTPDPPVIATTPLGAMAIWAVGILLCVIAMAWIATAGLRAGRR